jgi:hypothetical protein
MNVNSRPGLACALAAILMAGFAPVAARAGEPLIETQDFVMNHEVIANCGDFKIIGDGVGYTRLWTYFDSAGDPVKLVLHGFAKGIMANSVTGKFLTDDPSVANITVDLIKQTETNIGAFFTITVPGSGIVYFETGRIVYAGDGTPIFMAGQHQTPAEFIPVLCEALR